MAKFKSKQQRRSTRKQKKKDSDDSKLKRLKPNTKHGQLPSRNNDAYNNNNSDSNTKWKKDKFSKFGKKKSKNEQDSEESEVEVVSEKEIMSLSQRGKTSEDSDGNSEEEQLETRRLVTEQNRKKKKSGGFQSMGLSHSVYTGVIRKGYKVPTPIQRKTIPLIMEGKDMVAMARTGSGKTAAFLIPLLEKLQVHSGKSGARAIIMSPTRELALQTLKFTKELGKFTGLRAAVVLGGDRMEDQFSALHSSPDIIIGTPGRLLHVLVEMELTLSSVEYIVFDEADRLFEMGFREQLYEIINRLPESRQTVLFSATLPRLLVDFAKAGLHDPVLIRLDTDSKISEQLQTSFLKCRADDKQAVLLSLLGNVIRPNQQTVVFVATKHHVEYINMLLTVAGISCCYIYSSLDQTARKIAIGKFQQRKCTVLVVTDLAARGIDIPLLDNVINYNFPAKPKLFVHRVGRVARAGRSGTAYSLVSADELPFLMDLHLFLGRPLKQIQPDKKTEDADGCYGEVPQAVIDEASEHIRQWTETNIDLRNMKKVCTNAYKNYIRSCPAASSESIKRSKQMDRDNILLGMHPVFVNLDNNTEVERNKLLTKMKSYKPSTTIFEINSTFQNKAMDIMKKKRGFHQKTISSNIKRICERVDVEDAHSQHIQPRLDQSSQDDVEKTFSTVIEPRKRVFSGEADLSEVKVGKKNRVVPTKDEENYLNYRPSDFQTEKGLGLTNSFDQQASGLVLDLTVDDSSRMNQASNQLKWDRKKKKYVRTGSGTGEKKIRTESGAWIPASYRSNLYKEWLKKNQSDIADEGDESDGERQFAKFTVSGTSDRNKPSQRFGNSGAVTPTGKRQNSKKGRELKQPEQILKVRRKKAKQHAFQQKQHMKRQKRNVIQTSKSKKGSR